LRGAALDREGRGQVADHVNLVKRSAARDGVLRTAYMMGFGVMRCGGDAHGTRCGKPRYRDYSPKRTSTHHH
jgi:hypothetical protein